MPIEKGKTKLALSNFPPIFKQPPKLTQNRRLPARPKVPPALQLLLPPNPAVVPNPPKRVAALLQLAFSNSRKTAAHRQQPNRCRKGRQPIRQRKAQEAPETLIRLEVPEEGDFNPLGKRRMPQEEEEEAGRAAANRIRPFHQPSRPQNPAKVSPSSFFVCIIPPIVTGPFQELLTNSSQTATASATKTPVSPFQNDSDTFPKGLPSEAPVILIIGWSILIFQFQSN
jgi:hypothetical protein